MHWLPVTASVREVLSLFQQCLHQGTTNTGVAVSVDSVGEPRTGDADLGGVAALYYAVVSLTPFLHCFHGIPVSTPVLLLVSRRRQQGVWRTDWRTFVGKRVNKSSCGNWSWLSDPLQRVQGVRSSSLLGSIF